MALTQMDPPPWQSAAISSGLSASCADAIGAERMAKAAARPNFKDLTDMFILQSDRTRTGDREFRDKMISFACPPIRK
ncbi:MULTISPECIES: hypothetical protein [unclassified Mesorhizobium]|uniref:hypothetical protein n=1 Tax=unclassified Mesorhizobium TaxID=325217 RepID=UPI001FE15AE8|nr:MULTISPECIES: hypothetical protein [unclassified Mesorhizobium]